MNTETIEQRKQDLINQRNAEQARVNQLQAELQALQRNIIGVEGALLDCDYWLSQTKEEEANGIERSNGEKSGGGASGPAGNTKSDIGKSGNNDGDDGATVAAKPKTQAAHKSAN